MAESQSVGGQAGREFTRRSVAAGVGSTMMHMVSPAAVLNQTLPLFLLPVTASFGWTRAEFNLSFLFSSWTLAVIYPFAGMLMDRVGTPPVMVGAVFLLAASHIALGLQPGSLPFLYAVFVVMGLCGATLGQVPISKVICGWFHARRGLVLGLAATGAAAGAAITPLVTRVIIDLEGWRGAYFGLAAYVLVVGLPVMLFLVREAPEVVAARRSRGSGAAAAEPVRELPGVPTLKAFASAPFLLTASAGAITYAVMIGVNLNVAAIMSDRGAAEAVGAGYLSALALGQLVARVGEGMLLDKIQSPKLALPFVAIAVAGVLLLWLGQGSVTYVLAGGLIGAGIVGEASLAPYFLTRYFGLKNFAAIFAGHWAFAAVTTGVAPWIFSRLYDLTGSYDLVFQGAVGALVLAAILLFCLPAYRFPARLTD